MRKTRVREHVRAGSTVREHLRTLSPSDVREILARPATVWWTQRQIDDFNSDLNDVLVDNNDKTPEELDAIIIERVQASGMPPAQAAEVIEQNRAWIRDRTTDGDLHAALKVFDSYYGMSPASAGEAESLIDRAYDNAYDVLLSEHSFALRKHEAALAEAQASLLDSYDEDMEE